MKPLIYGYLRATDDLDDNEIRRRELGLEKLADAEGRCLATIYYECTPSRQGAFNDLQRKLKRRRHTTWSRRHWAISPVTGSARTGW